MICDQHWDLAAARLVPDVPDRCVLVWPQPGRFATFAGDRVHSVLESGFAAPRLTFLINWWALEPEGLARLPLSAPPFSCSPAAWRPDAAVRGK